MLKNLIPMSMLLAALSACGTEIPDFRTGAGAASPAAAPAPMSAVARFEQAVTDQGCVLDTTNTAEVMAAATLSREDLGRAIDSLRADGRGQIGADGASFRLTTGACAGV